MVALRVTWRQCLAQVRGSNLRERHGEEHCPLGSPNASRRPDGDSVAERGRRDRGRARGAGPVGRVRGRGPASVGTPARRRIRGEPADGPRGAALARRARAHRRRARPRRVRPGDTGPRQLPAARPGVPPPRHDRAPAVRDAAMLETEAARSRPATRTTTDLAVLEARSTVSRRARRRSNGSGTTSPSTPRSSRRPTTRSSRRCSPRSAASRSS